MNLGFIGTGKISSSIINGIFKTNLKIKNIYISSRNINIAKKLKKKFYKVKICKDNQDIINNSSVIFLSVTPIVGKKILDGLKFGKNKNIISLISTIKINQLKKLTKSNRICKAIPLPFIENCFGPVIISPANKTAKKIFSKLGQVIEIRSEKIAFSFWSTSSVMAAYYELFNQTSNWLVQKGLKQKIANSYTSDLFSALSKDAQIKKNEGFKKLVSESQTPNGLNMQVLKELKKTNFYKKYTTSLNNIYRRIKR